MLQVGLLRARGVDISPSHRSWIRRCIWLYDSLKGPIGNTRLSHTSPGKFQDLLSYTWAKETSPSRLDHTEPKHLIPLFQKHTTYLWNAELWKHGYWCWKQWKTVGCRNELSQQIFHEHIRSAGIRFWVNPAHPSTFTENRTDKRDWGGHPLNSSQVIILTD